MAMQPRAAVPPPAHPVASMAKPLSPSTVVAVFTGGGAGLASQAWEDHFWTWWQLWWPKYRVI